MIAYQGIPAALNRTTVFSSASAAPAATAVPSGTVIDIPTFGGEWISDGTYWRPRRGTATIFVRNADSAVTGTASETTLDTYAWPAGFAAPQGQWKVEFLFGHTNSANNKTLKVKFSTGAFYSAVHTTYASTQGVCIMRNSNNVSVQIGHVSSQAGGYGATAGTQASNAIPTQGAMNIDITGQLANTGETITLRGWTLKYEATA